MVSEGSVRSRSRGGKVVDGAQDHSGIYGDGNEEAEEVPKPTWSIHGQRLNGD